MKVIEPRIVFLDAATYGDANLQLFRERWSCTVHATTPFDRTSERLAGHTVAVTNKVVLHRAILESEDARDLKLIAVAATGTDVIDKEAARRQGIAVCNVPGYATQAVAQHTMALILELASRVGGYVEMVRAGHWERSPVFSLIEQSTLELHGRILGIVGYGSIGRAVAVMARGFGLEVLVSARPHLAAAPAQGRTPWEEVLRNADILSLHCPLTPETKELIRDETLALMKPTSLLINTARGGLVNEQALIRALRQGSIAGAALDVISREPPAPDLPILKAAKAMGNLLITPHIAWTARETRERLLAAVAANIAAFLAGSPTNCA